MQVSSVLRRTTEGYTFFCPGCREIHHVWTDSKRGQNWGFDGNVEKPTFTPSILVTGKETEKDENDNWTGEWVRNPDGTAKDQRCHSFVTNGRILFLSDCTHPLAGQTVDIPTLPQHLED